MIRKRVASLDDATIHRLVIEQIAPFSSTFQPSDATPRQIRKRLDRGVTFVTAKGGRRAFGFISTLRRQGDLFIDMLAVDPGAQGRGWGGQLLHAAEAHGRARGCRHVKLFVDFSNEKAFGFYAKHGYRVEQQLPQISCYLLNKALR
ncbi:GNAT family N-acetyltransferase [Paenibacillus athensensis]|uniref:N-acetyltransferase domain-containing protein n=1 Tax=Paenibacillus athensensis TaxID=1967502 RepID=A0A4Y8PXF1_9BACL|nr:GNAT family N-acetyltransferase [Paenibacillus athensensis]MCD1259920.1 GNAT family N-acetyltransferase [Paenibacillus athensensis]